MNWAADFEVALFRYPVNNIKNNLGDAYFRDMTRDTMTKLNKWLVSIARLSDISATIIRQKFGFRSIENYMRNMRTSMKPDVFAMIERELRQWQSCFWFGVCHYSTKLYLEYFMDMKMGYRNCLLNFYGLKL